MDRSEDGSEERKEETASKSPLEEGETDEAFCTIRPDEVPPVPDNKFLKRGAKEQQQQQQQRDNEDRRRREDNNKRGRGEHDDRGDKGRDKDNRYDTNHIYLE